MPAVVPGTVLTSLLANDRIPDPYVGKNNLHCVWAEKKTWWYRTEFTLPETFADLDLRLEFDGLDYHARVSLNGELLGEHVGMFGGPDFDISATVRRDGANELLIEILPAPTEWRGELKASVLYGWHYGRYVSAGPWQAVRLVGFRGASIESVVVRVDTMTTTKARLAGGVVLGPPEQIDSETVVRVQIIDPDGGVAVSTEIKTNGSVTVPFGMDISDPRIWWPHDLGDQPRYTAVVTAIRNGVTTDRVEVAFGIRTYEWFPTEGKKDSDYDWILATNGTKQFLKGANWSFTDSLLRFSEANYRYHLTAARDAGINLLRVWGGGVVETKLFYDICDELGILVWQEFPFTHPQTVDSRRLLAVRMSVVEEQATRIVARLRNRACLLMWCGGNEHGGKGDVIDTLAETCGDLDPTRAFHRASPYGGDSHDWSVYHHNLAPLTAYTKNQTPFMSEFGLACPPSLKTIAAFTLAGEETVWPPPSSGSLVHHMPEYGGSPDLIKMLRYATEYGDIQTTEQFVRYMQLAQAHALRVGVEHARAGMLVRTGGVAIYKLNDIGVGITWSAVDWYGRTKPAYYFVKRAYEPVHVFAPYRNANFFASESMVQQVCVANDGDRLFGVRLTADIVTTEFALVDRHEKTIDIAARGASVAMEINRSVPEDDQGRALPLFLVLTLQDADGDRLSRSVYWYNFSNAGAAHYMACRPVFDDLSWRVGCLDRLIATTLEVRSVEQKPPGVGAGSNGVLAGDRRAAVLVKNTGDVPAFMVELDTVGETVVLFDDGAFWLDPGEERTITARLHPNAGLGAGSKTRVTARAWNAGDAPAVEQSSFD